MVKAEKIFQKLQLFHHKQKYDGVRENVTNYCDVFCSPWPVFFTFH